MKLLKYIHGNRRGKDVNSLEKEAMKDSFLSDAMQGYEKVEGYDHDRRITAMRTQITRKTHSGKHILRYLSIAAGILLIIGFGGRFWLNQNQRNTEEHIAIVKSAPKSEMLSAPAPDMLSRNNHPQVMDEDDIEESSEHELQMKASQQRSEVKVEEKTKAEMKPDVATVAPVAQQRKIHKETEAQQEIQEIVTESEPDLTPISAIAIAENERVDAKTSHKELKTGKVRGIIVDKEGEPLPGATVVYSGTNTGVVSDTAGYFELPESTEKNIMINYLGYETVNLIADADADTTMLIAMTESNDALAEVTIVAFGKQKKETVIGTVSPEKEVRIKSQPVIGLKKYKEYLETNLIRPLSEDCKGKKGRVKLKFSIGALGRPVNIRVEKSLCPEADNEAIRLIAQGSDWTAGDKDVEIEVKF